jgi:hypothetical protein
MFDKQNEFADAVTVALAAGTTNLGNQIDLLQARDVGAGRPLWLVINVATAIVTGGAAGTIQFRLVSDDTASISTTACSVHLISPAFVTDDDPTIPVGTQLFCAALPLCQDFVSVSVAGVPVTTGPGAPYERFLGVQVIVGTTTITAGAVNAYLTLDPHGLKQYADAVN